MKNLKIEQVKKMSQTNDNDKQTSKQIRKYLSLLILLLIPMTGFSQDCTTDSNTKEEIYYEYRYEIDTSYIYSKIRMLDDLAKEYSNPNATFDDSFEVKLYKKLKSIYGKNENLALDCINGLKYIYLKSHEYSRIEAEFVNMGKWIGTHIRGNTTLWASKQFDELQANFENFKVIVNDLDKKREDFSKVFYLDFNITRLYKKEATYINRYRKLILDQYKYLGAYCYQETITTRDVEYYRKLSEYAFSRSDGTTFDEIKRLEDFVMERHIRVKISDETFYTDFIPTIKVPIKRKYVVTEDILSNQ